MKMTFEGPKWVYMVAVMTMLAFALTLHNAAYNAPMLVLLITGVVCLIRFWRELWSIEGWRWFLAIWACFWIPQVVSLVDAFEAERATQTTLAFVRFPVAAAALFLAMHRWPGIARWILAGVLAWCAFLAADLLLQWLTGKDLFGFPARGGRLSGPTSLLKVGFVLGVVLPVLLESVRMADRLKWLLGGVAALTVLMILASGHRGGWLSMAIGAAFWGGLLLSRLPVRRLVGTLSAAVLVVALLSVLAADRVVPYFDRLEQTLLIFKGDSASVDLALSKRPRFWSAGWSMFEQHPINGVGPRGYRFILESDESLRNVVGLVGTHPHQMVIEVAAETGSIGLVGYLLACLLVVRAIWRRRGGLGAAWMTAGFAAMFPLNMSLALYSTYWSHVIFLMLMLGFAWPRDGNIR